MIDQWELKGQIAELKIVKDGFSYFAFVRPNNFTIFVCMSVNGSTATTINQHVYSSGVCANREDGINKVEELLKISSVQSAPVFVEHKEIIVPTEDNPMAEEQVEEKKEKIFDVTVSYEHTKDGYILKCDSPDAVVRYTTNGKSVRSTNKNYKAPILVPSGTPIRFAAFIDDVIVSKQIKVIADN